MFYETSTPALISTGRMIKRSVLILLFLFSFRFCIACTCGILPPDFMISAQIYLQSIYAYQTHISMLKVIDVRNGYGIRAKVLKKYYGNNQNAVGDTVTIWGDYGTTCRFSPVGQYAPADTMIAMTVTLANNSSVIPPESSADYYISSCGFYHLRYSADSVFGGSIGSFTYNGYPVTSFEDSLSQLTAHVAVPYVSGIAPLVYFYPLPTSGLLHYAVANGHKLSACIIKDISGSTVSANYAVTDNNEINLHELPPGFYFITAILDDRVIITQKTEKQ